MIRPPSCRKSFRPARAAGSGIGALAVAALSATSLAQESTGQRRLDITPTLGVSVEFLEVSGRTQGDVGGEFISRLSPGLQFSSRSGRVVGSLSYVMDLVAYSKQSQDNGVQNALYADLSAVAVENWAFVDLQASVAQQNLSPFGQQSTGDSLAVNENRGEVANIAIFPYVSGQLGGQAQYRAGVSAEATNTRDSTSGDSITTGAFFSLGSLRQGTIFGWGLDGSQRRVDFRTGRTTDEARIFATLTASPEPDLQFSLRGGQEANNISSLERQRYDNWGAGVRWQPSPRTLVDINADRRYFGRGHAVVLQYRLPRSVLRYTSTRDDTGGAGPTGVGQPLSLYQVFDAQFASIQPDPALRDQLVRDFLRSTGQDPNATVTSGFVASEVRVERRDDVSFALLGRRYTTTLQAFYSDSSPASTTLDQPTFGQVRQYGSSLSLAYRLTPSSSVNLSGTLQKTLGDDGQSGNDLQSLNLGWTERMSESANLSLGARYTVYDSTTDPYRETSVQAALSLRF